MERPYGGGADAENSQPLHGENANREHGRTVGWQSRAKTRCVLRSNGSNQRLMETEPEESEPHPASTLALSLCGGRTTRKRVPKQTLIHEGKVDFSEAVIHDPNAVEIHLLCVSSCVADTI